jgi:hypothetical protein
MKYRFTSLFLFVCLWFASLATSLAQLTSSGVTPAPSYDTFQPPAVGSMYADPAFGATIKRVSNALTTRNADQGGYLTWIETEYATMSPFNSDNSRFILLHQSYFALYDGTGFYMFDLPLEINSSSEPRWSRTDASTLYFHSGNQLKSYNASTGSIAVVHTFSEYSAISGNGEMDISADGDHFVFAGDNRYIFVYQISADKKFTAFDSASRPFDSMYITPDNNVIVSWFTSGTARYNGQELFDSNMNFLRQVGHADGHKDVTRDTNGDEVLIWTNSDDPQPIPNCNNGIVKVRLADGAQTCLLQLDWSLAVHISAPDGNGSVYVDTEAPANPESGSSGWKAYTDEILQVKLDGSGATRWAHHRSRPLSSYNWQPKLSVSRDGSRLLYGSNYDLPKILGGNTEYADAYLLVFGTSTSAAPTTPPVSTITPPATPAPAASTASIARAEQDNPAVGYSGTWYPNGGAFNSGNSAALAVDAGSQAKFTFTGTGVKWIGYRDAWSGIATVSVDGVLQSTMDTYSANTQAQAVEFEVNNLSNGVHTLTITVTGQRNSASGGAWVWVDAFDVISGAAATATSPATSPAASTSSPVRTEQSNSAVAYSGGSWFQNGGAANSGGSAALSMDPGARATLTFTGSAVSWIGYRDEWSGIARVYIDGVSTATVDTYATPSKSQGVVYAASGLTPGSHTIAVEATGTHGAASAGAWVWVDAFDVTP